MIKYMDKILFGCMIFSGIAAIYLSFTSGTNLLYVG